MQAMDNQRKSVGTTGLPGALASPVGIGYVVIPYGVERADYIKTCYQTETICIRTEGGDFFKNVPVSVDQMESIVFPKEVGTATGSVVAFAVVPKHNAPVVFAVLGLKDTVGKLIEEGQIKLNKSTEQHSVDIDMRTNGVAQVNISASGEGSSMFFKLASPNADSVFDIKTKGEVNVYGSKLVRLFAEEEVRLELVDDKLEPIAHIRYNKGTGIWEIFGDSASSGQAAVLGDDWIEKAEKMCDLIGSIAQNVSTMTVGVLAPQSPSGPPINAASFAQIKTQISQLKTQLKSTLSKKVKID
jgi:hypothetical protein